MIKRVLEKSINEKTGSGKAIIINRCPSDW